MKTLKQNIHNYIKSSQTLLQETLFRDQESKSYHLDSLKIIDNNRQYVDAVAWEDKKYVVFYNKLTGVCSLSQSQIGQIKNICKMAQTDNAVILNSTFLIGDIDFGNLNIWFANNCQVEKAKKLKNGHLNNFNIINGKYSFKYNDDVYKALKNKNIQVYMTNFNVFNMILLNNERCVLENMQILGWNDIEMFSGSVQTELPILKNSQLECSLLDLSGHPVYGYMRRGLTVQDIPKYLQMIKFDEKNIKCSEIKYRNAKGSLSTEKIDMKTMKLK